MDDDFNTAQALGALFDLARAINQSADAGENTSEAQELLKSLAGEVLGLRLPAQEARTEVEASPFIDLLVRTRYNLRQAKQFQLADEIRTKLAELGITLEDTSQGTVWKRKKRGQDA
jgi:cysteinyl-tRNA synthetase